MAFGRGEKPSSREEGIGPALMIGTPTPATPAAALAQNASQAHPHAAVEGRVFALLCWKYANQARRIGLIFATMASRPGPLLMRMPWWRVSKHALMSASTTHTYRLLSNAARDILMRFTPPAPWWLRLASGRGVGAVGTPTPLSVRPPRPARQRSWPCAPAPAAS